MSANLGDGIKQQLENVPKENMETVKENLGERGIKKSKLFATRKSLMLIPGINKNEPRSKVPTKKPLTGKSMEEFSKPSTSVQTNKKLGMETEMENLGERIIKKPKLFVTRKSLMLIPGINKNKRRSKVPTEKLLTDGTEEFSKPSTSVQTNKKLGMETVQENLGERGIKKRKLFATRKSPRINKNIPQSKVSIKKPLTGRSTEEFSKPSTSVQTNKKLGKETVQENLGERGIKKRKLFATRKSPRINKNIPQSKVSIEKPLTGRSTEEFSKPSTSVQTNKMLGKETVQENLGERGIKKRKLFATRKSPRINKNIPQSKVSIEKPLTGRSAEEFSKPSTSVQTNKKLGKETVQENLGERGIKKRKLFATRKSPRINKNIPQSKVSIEKPLTGRSTEEFSKPSTSVQTNKMLGKETVQENLGERGIKKRKLFATRKSPRINKNIPQSKVSIEKPLTGRSAEEFSKPSTSVQTNKKLGKETKKTNLGKRGIKKYKQDATNESLMVIPGINNNQPTPKSPTEEPLIGDIMEEADTPSTSVETNEMSESDEDEFVDVCTIDPRCLPATTAPTKDLFNVIMFV